MMLLIAFPDLRRGVGNAQRFPRGCGQAEDPKGGPSARCRQAIRRLSMAPAALRRGRNQAIIQATNCLKVLDAFRFAGPVYWGRTVDIEKISPKEIWVPTALWKTVIWIDDKGEERTCSWIIPHRADIARNAYMEYIVSIQDVYKKTGVNVLPTKTHPLYTRVDAQKFIPLGNE